ncbi:MAG: hypothetical protein L3J33_03405 [Rhodobacteraceae bacterium]|nr:hypothetical protein [Paracoccaceae bacterium]
MRFAAKHWEWFAGAFITASAVYWIAAAIPDAVAPDRYTATDAAADRAVIEKQIEALQIEVSK